MLNNKKPLSKKELMQNRGASVTAVRNSDGVFVVGTNGGTAYEKGEYFIILFVNGKSNYLSLNEYAFYEAA